VGIGVEIRAGPQQGHIGLRRGAFIQDDRILHGDNRTIPDSDAEQPVQRQVIQKDWCGSREAVSIGLARVAGLPSPSRVRNPAPGAGSPSAW
jgi:hypothetical protein